MTTNLLAQEDGEISLQYEGKEPEESVIQNTKPAQLKEKHRSEQTSIATWSNMLVYGDNLHVLKTLHEMPEVRGQVRLVYIDPPFATGREFNGNHTSEKAYQDVLKGAAFLEFLRKRLILLREIMADNGSIYVHIDWKMSHYVRILMDQVFKPEHFINDITRIKCNPKNFERPAYGNIKDTVLFYSKGASYAWNEAREKMTEEDIERLFPRIDKDGKRYTTNPLHAPSETREGPTGQPWKGMLPPKGRHWRYPPERLTILDNLGLIEWSGKQNPRKRIYAEDAIARGKKRQDIWEFKDPAYPRYPTEKNIDMLKTIINASSNSGDIVLDAFSGSGATLVAASELGRRWIGIDNSKMAIRVTQARLQEVKGKEPTYPFVLHEALA